MLDWSFTTLNSAIGEDVANLIIDSRTNRLMGRGPAAGDRGQRHQRVPLRPAGGGWAGSARLITDNRDEIWP